MDKKQWSDPLFLKTSRNRVFHKLDEIGNNVNISIRGYAFSCKTETLGSLCDHALVISTKSSKSKNQVVHKHKFKDPHMPD